MRLTNTIRDAFVRAAMADVPTVDYQEQMKSLVLKEVEEKLPPEVKAVYKKEHLRPFLETYYLTVSNQYYSVHGFRNAYTPSSDLLKKVRDIEKKYDEQSERISDLRNKLQAVAYSVSTREALVKALPEFEKYLPENEEKACRTLPVIANVVSDFVKAGWPKKEVKTSRKAT